MKILKKVLVVICLILIGVGAFIVVKNGFQYAEGYTKNMLIETAKQYIPYVAISTAIILLYLGIRYNNQGVLKVVAKTIIGIIGTAAVLLSILAIIKFPMSRIVFSIMLVAYVASIIVSTAMLEENT